MFPISGQALTLANSIIGVGILAMPFCFERCGIILSIFLLLLSGLVSRLSSHLLLRSAVKTRRRNFESLAFNILGKAGKLIVEIGTIGFLMGTCVAYFVVVGDLGPQIVAKMFNIDQSNTLRTAVMVVISVVCVLPLGLLRDVDSLSNVCAITICFYFCLVLKVIYEAGGEILNAEWIHKVEYWQPNGVLRCLPIFSMSLFCQTQIFEIYETIQFPTIEKMNFVTKSAVHICTIFYVLVGFFGYIAYANQHISGNILTNFSPSFTTDVIKMGFVMSLAFSFPLMIFPCRASLYSLLYKKGHISPHDVLSSMIPDYRFKCLTVGIIAVSLTIGLMLPNIEFVLGFIGSTIGVIICVIFPATCFICITFKSTGERLVAQMVLAFGVIIMVLGTYANLQSAEIDSIHFKYKLIHSADIRKNPYFDKKIMKNVPSIKDEIKLLNAREMEDFDVRNSKDSHLQPPNPVMPIEEKPVESVERNDILKFPKKKDDIIIDEKSKQLNADAVAEKESQIESDKIRNDDGVLSKRDKVGDAEETDFKNEVDTEKKKQDLMDTIKRHEEEQRQIINEQKEILKEMKKTKNEIEQDNLLKKVDAVNQNSVENKKIALESIQKLAKLAIESLGGQLDLSENPLEKPKKPNKPQDAPAHANAIDNEVAKSNPIPVNNLIMDKIADSVKSDFDGTDKKDPIKSTDAKQHSNIVNSPESLHIPSILENQPNSVGSKNEKAVVPAESRKETKVQSGLDAGVNDGKKDEVINEDLVGGKRDLLQILVKNETDYAPL